MDYNKCCFIGRIAKPVDARNTQTNLVATTSLAINNRKSDEATFINLTFFDKTAELAATLLSKGDKVFIESSVKINKHEDKYYTNFVVHNFICLSPKKDD